MSSSIVRRLLEEELYKLTDGYHYDSTPQQRVAKLEAKLKEVRGELQHAKIKLEFHNEKIAEVQKELDELK